MDFLIIKEEGQHVNQVWPTASLSPSINLFRWESVQHNQNHYNEQHFGSSLPLI